MITTPETTLDEVLQDTIRTLYPVLSKVYEGLESKGLLHGNGHHMAQNMSAVCANLIHERWNNEAERKAIAPRGNNKGNPAQYIFKASA